MQQGKRVVKRQPTILVVFIRIVHRRMQVPDFVSEPPKQCIATNTAIAPQECTVECGAYSGCNRLGTKALFNCDHHH
jgi:hypothetical protein